jgi:hypothetical protein
MATKRFWKFVNQENKSLNPRGKPLVYEVGAILEVPDADTDNVQCSSGIHCLAVTKEAIDPYNVSFGPKIAILEAEDEDVIYFEISGKCRLRKCKVIDVLTDPPGWMKTGNGHADFTKRYWNGTFAKTKCQAVKQVAAKNGWLIDYYYETKSWSTEVVKAIRDSATPGSAAMQFAKQIGKPYPSLEEIAINSGYMIEWAKQFGINPQYEKHLNNINDRYEYAILMQGDISENLARQIGKDGKYFAYLSGKLSKPLLAAMEEAFLSDGPLENVCRYAVKQNQENARVTQALLSGEIKWDRYFDNGVYRNYVYHFETPERKFADAVLQSNDKAFICTYALEGGATPAMLTVLAGHSDLALKYMTKYGYQDELIQSMEKIKLPTYSGSDFNIYDYIQMVKTHGHNKKLDRLLINGFEASYNWEAATCANLALYTHYCGLTDDMKEALQPTVKKLAKLAATRVDGYLRDCILKTGGDTVLFHYLMEVLPQIPQVQEFKNQKRFWKVCRVLRNGARVSAFATKESKKRKSYISGGNVQIVDKGMVFSNEFEAREFINKNKVVMPNKERLELTPCTGINPVAIKYVVNSPRAYELDDEKLAKLNANFDPNKTHEINAIQKQIGGENALLEVQYTYWLENIKVHYDIRW